MGRQLFRADDQRYVFTNARQTSGNESANAASS